MRLALLLLVLSACSSAPAPSGGFLSRTGGEMRFDAGTWLCVPGQSPTLFECARAP